MNNEKVKELTQKHFDETAGDYNTSHDGKFVKCMYDEILERIVAINPETVLDLGCGNGNVLKKIMDISNAKLFGLDLSPKMIESAQKKLGEKVTLEVGDAEKLPYAENQFDIVICNASFHHYPNPDRVLSEIKRVLKNGGILILGDPTAPFEWYLKILNWGLKWSNSGDFRIYGAKEITALLSKNGFQVSGWKKIKNRAFVINAISEI
ncbi:class I SAM-dependent methyltransferase [Acetobacterium woodii]|uniref:Putative methyltransferase n=1 Tax=Acetobacterium woodii (strain ATCC 29683 / DSM 1030 / JCM 2381 / KCTC 1655 / WB1) TaxID=931626 RepID=H6LHF0_ACEWD|nr:class I SAM-dependent methyltransferase [Acetobacterium woodii]AFA49660.1 putative methyltransferase [Acetobacterium woodii DSM 1030]